MAYESKGKETVIFEQDLTEFTKVRVKKIENEELGVVQFDIRQFFHTKSDPTEKAGKGIRVTADMMKDIIESIKANS